METKVYTKEEIAECTLSAIENWNWDEDDEAEEKIEALKHLADHPELLLETDEDTFTCKDIWDFLSEYATATAGNIIAARH